jgi:predicted permease
MMQPLRYWTRHWAHAAWLIGSLGIAAGLAAAFLSVGYVIWWRPLPVRAPHELVRVHVDSPTRDDGALPPGVYPLWKERQSGLAALGSFQFDAPMFVDTDEGTTSVDSVHVTTNLFDVMGVSPIAGRLFVPGDAPRAAPEVAIISERLWRRAFNGDPGVIGRTLTVRTTARGVQPAAIVGVLPDGFDLQTFYSKGIDLFRPVTDDIAGEGFGTYRVNSRHLIARVPSDRPRAEIEQRLSGTARDVARELGLRSAPTGVRLVPLHEDLYGTNRPFVTLLVLAGAFTLLVAVANASGVLLAQASHRTQEHAIRRALGASSSLLARQFAAEALLIGVAAGIVAVIAAQWTTAWLVAMAPPDIRRAETAALGWTQSLALAAVTAVIAVLISLISLLRRRLQVSIALRSTAGGTMTAQTLRLRRALLSGQTAIVLVLLTTGCLTAAAFWRLSRQPVGFSDQGVYVVALQLPSTGDTPTGSLRTRVADLRRTLLASPGRREVAAAIDLPLRKRFGWTPVALPDGRRVTVVDNRVSDGFFRLLGIPIVAGRELEPEDTGLDRVVVNREFADRYLGGPAAAVGARLPQVGAVRTHEVVGVVGNVREQDLAMRLDPVIYPPVWGLRNPSALYLLVREQTGDGRTIARIRSMIRRADPEIFADVSPLSERRRMQLATATLQSTLIGGLAVFTLLLALMGIYAMVAQLAADRAREVGIRTALGATTGALTRLLARTTFSAIAAGTAVGLGLTFVAVRFLERFLFETDAFDLRLWAVGISALLGTAAIASVLPARRAARVDPAGLLRRE